MLLLRNSPVAIVALLRISAHQLRHPGRPDRTSSSNLCWIHETLFGGLSVEETTEVLQISPQSVMRDWKLAKAGWPGDGSEVRLKLSSPTAARGMPFGGSGFGPTDFQLDVKRASRQVNHPSAGRPAQETISDYTLKWLRDCQPTGLNRVKSTCLVSSFTRTLPPRRTLVAA